jgi:hypothetical protein
MNVDLSSSFLGAQKQKKKDHDESRLVVVFSGCIERKEKKTMTSVSLSSSSLGA